MTTTKVFIEDGQSCFFEVFRDIGCQIVDKPELSDVIVLKGGADIHQVWYGSVGHPQTHGNIHRDKTTADLYQHAIENGKPVLGICRGGQFINALVGGNMYEHVNGHQGHHKVVDQFTGEVYTVNSIHHQMMLPTDAAVKIAKAIGDHGPVASFRHVMEDTRIIDHPVTEEEPEWEVLYYPHIQGLCFQAHPEYAERGSDTRRYFHYLLRTYLPQYFDNK